MDNNSFLPPVSKRSKQFTTLNGIGHRGRMRSKLFQRGANAFEDYELLEMLLYLIIPRKDTKPIAKDLINKFKSLSKMFNTSKEQLEEYNLSNKFIELILLVNIIKKRLIQSDLIHRPYIASWNDIATYLNHFPYNKTISKGNNLRVIFLDNKKHIIADEYTRHKDKDTISIILKKALTIYAVNIITIYFINLKTMNAGIYQNEEKFSLTLKQSCGLFDINITDHVIYSNQQYFSVFTKSFL